MTIIWTIAFMALIYMAILLGDKTDGGWKEVMSKISEAHPASNLAERYGKKTVKQSQIEKTIKKHRDRKSKGGGR